MPGARSRSAVRASETAAAVEEVDPETTCRGQVGGGARGVGVSRPRWLRSRQRVTPSYALLSFEG